MQGRKNLYSSFLQTTLYKPLVFLNTYVPPAISLFPSKIAPAIALYKFLLNLLNGRMATLSSLVIMSPLEKANGSHIREQTLFQKLFLVESLPINTSTFFKKPNFGFLDSGILPAGSIISSS